VGAVLGAGWALASIRGTLASPLGTATLTGLALARLAAFPLATLPVARAATLDTGLEAGPLWVRHFVPTAPGFLAASGLALFLVLAVLELGLMSLLFYVRLSVLAFTRSLPLPAATGRPS